MDARRSIRPEREAEKLHPQDPPMTSSVLVSPMTTLIAISGGNDLASFRASVGHLKQTVSFLSDWGGLPPPAGEAKVSQKLLDQRNRHPYQIPVVAACNRVRTCPVSCWAFAHPPTFDNPNGVSDPSNRKFTCSRTEHSVLIVAVPVATTRTDHQQEPVQR